MNVSAMGGLTQQIAYQQVGNQVRPDTTPTQAKAQVGNSDNQQGAPTQTAPMQGAHTQVTSTHAVSPGTFNTYA